MTCRVFPGVMRRARWRRSRRAALASAAFMSLVCAAVAFTPSVLATTRSTLTISIVGTSDLHGYFMERGGRGGIALFAGYVNNLRAARAADGGAVLLLDAGDTFQ